MSAKTKPKKPDSTAVTLMLSPGEDAAAAPARSILAPTTQSACTIVAYQGTYNGDMPVTAVIDEIRKQCVTVLNGDMARCEAMLVAQAHTLDALFGEFARRGRKAETMGQLEPYLRIAMRAQSQCRATWETLAAIKNPAPVAFVKQANITTGPQQVNNGVRADAEHNAGARTHAQEKEIQPTKLQGPNYGGMDTRTPAATVRIDTGTPAMEEVNRATDGGG